MSIPPNVQCQYIPFKMGRIIFISLEIKRAPFTFEILVLESNYIETTTSKFYFMYTISFKK